jgi:hypothetical protein
MIVRNDAFLDIIDRSMIHANTLYYESSPFPFSAHSSISLQDVSKVDVGSFGLSSHTSIGRLDGIGRTILLVSDLVLPPHLKCQRYSKYTIMVDLRRTIGDRGRWS